MFIQEFSERLAFRIRDTLEHQIQRCLCGTNGTHAVMNPTRSRTQLVNSMCNVRSHTPQTSLDDLKLHVNIFVNQDDQIYIYLKTSSPAQNEIAQRNTDIIIDDFAMSFRSVIISKDLHRPDDFHTGCVCWNYDDTLLVVSAIVSGIALPHYEMYFSSRVTCPANPPGQSFSFPVSLGRCRECLPFMTVDDNLVALSPD